MQGLLIWEQGGRRVLIEAGSCDGSDVDVNVLNPRSGGGDGLIFAFHKLFEQLCVFDGFDINGVAHDG